jgi:hypothetical protein
MPPRRPARRVDNTTPTPTDCRSHFGLDSVFDLNFTKFLDHFVTQRRTSPYLLLSSIQPSVYPRQADQQGDKKTS